MKFCGSCQFLSLTENEQNQYKICILPHRCTLFNKVLKHGISHPEIPCLKECEESYIKEITIENIKKVGF